LCKNLLPESTRRSTKMRCHRLRTFQVPNGKRQSISQDNSRSLQRLRRGNGVGDQELRISRLWTLPIPLRKEPQPSRTSPLRFVFWLEIIVSEAFFRIKANKMTITPTKPKTSKYVRKVNEAIKRRNRRILALRKQGKNYSDIALKMGMSKQLVRWICIEKLGCG